MATMLRCALVASIISFGLLVVAFCDQTKANVQSDSLPRSGIVFTGQFNRIRLGLQLIEEGQIDTLFISGVNAGAGINPATFAEQFELSPALVEYLKTSKIVLATSAQSTFENAIETTCWLKNKNVKSVVLITSKSHMARAYVALKKTSPDILEIHRRPVRVPVMSSRDRVSLYAREFLKYSATWLHLTISNSIWSKGESLLCEGY